MEKGYGSGAAPFFISNLYIYFIKLEGVHRQDRRIYFPWRFIGLGEKFWKWGVDNNFRNLEMGERAMRKIADIGSGLTSQRAGLS
jgi:hypothetical protein